jgi:hypothetical protein
MPKPGESVFIPCTTDGLEAAFREAAKQLPAADTRIGSWFVEEKPDGYAFRWMSSRRDAR